MGQREGFTNADLMRLNSRYCQNSPETSRYPPPFPGGPGPYPNELGPFPGGPGPYPNELGPGYPPQGED